MSLRSLQLFYSQTFSTLALLGQQPSSVHRYLRRTACGQYYQDLTAAIVVPASSMFSRTVLMFLIQLDIKQQILGLTSLPQKLYYRPLMLMLLRYTWQTLGIKLQKICIIALQNQATELVLSIGSVHIQNNLIRVRNVVRSRLQGSKAIQLQPKNKSKREITLQLPKSLLNSSASSSVNVSCTVTAFACYILLIRYSPLSFFIIRNQLLQQLLQASSTILRF